MIAIGVTGHRILSELDKINAGIDQSLDYIGKRFPGQFFTIISSLAEGADRLAAHRVLARPNARLVAALPMSKAEYMADFESSESKRLSEKFRQP